MIVTTFADCQRYAAISPKLKTAFDFIKRNYQIINTLSGCFLILTGIMMATGTLGRLLNILSFS